ncbi:MAG: LacI family transcriptional regulator, partial [Proteobacteria bacterium]
MSQKADSRPVSIRDVAALAGVSLSTASRAINNAPNVNEEIRKKVARAVTVLGYRPNHAAQSLRRRS